MLALQHFTEKHKLTLTEVMSTHRKLARICLVDFASGPPLLVALPECIPGILLKSVETIAEDGCDW